MRAELLYGVIAASSGGREFFEAEFDAKVIMPLHDFAISAANRLVRLQRSEQLDGVCGSLPHRGNPEEERNRKTNS